jgi:hypothetical protein
VYVKQVATADDIGDMFVGCARGETGDQDRSLVVAQNASLGAGIDGVGLSVSGVLRL